MNYREIMLDLDKKLEAITNNRDYFDKKKQYKKNMEFLFYSVIGVAYHKFCTSLNTRYGTSLSGHNFGMASIKFAELFRHINDPIKSAIFVGELPGNAAITCMFLNAGADIIITSPLNSEQSDVADDASAPVSEASNAITKSNSNFNSRSRSRSESKSESSTVADYSRTAGGVQSQSRSTTGFGWGKNVKTNKQNLKVEIIDKSGSLTIKEVDLLDDTYGIRNLPQWRSFESAMIQDSRFKRELKTNKSLGKSWLISDIGFELNQEVEQKVVTSSILEVLAGEINGIASDGVIIKLYNFGEGDVLNDLVKISKMYSTIYMIKPEGSPVSNNEIYMIFKNKLAIFGEGVDKKTLLDRRMALLQKTVNFYKQYNKRLTTIPFNRTMIDGTIEFMTKNIKGFKKVR